MSILYIEIVEFILINLSWEFILIRVKIKEEKKLWEFKKCRKGRSSHWFVVQDSMGIGDSYKLK
jgi:hypothetical protein